jgi:hypothetical protein
MKLNSEFFQNLEFQLVVYDEVEYFKKYNNPEFNYPFQKRKTILGSYNFDIAIPLDYDYSYFSKVMSF